MKKIIMILIPGFATLAVCSLAVFIFLTQAYRSIPRELEYPVSGLSESIFDSQGQNMKYEPDENLTAVHAFDSSPYTFDVLDTDRADVGEHGAVYKVSESVYIYTTEVPNGTSVDSLIKKELSKAVMVDASLELSVIDNLVYDEGYKNGFKADYYIDRLTVSNLSRSASVYLTGYMLTLTDASSMHGYDLFLGIVTAQASTETFQEAKGMLDTLVGTLRYDEKIQTQLLQQEAEDERENRYADTSIATSGYPGSDLAAQADKGLPGTAEPQADYSLYKKNEDGNTDAIPRQKEKSIAINEEYRNVTLYYYYENTGQELELVLHNPANTEDFVPESMEDGTAVFKLDYMEVGKWHMTVTGNPGTESIRLYSEVFEREE